MTRLYRDYVQVNSLVFLSGKVGKIGEQVVEGGVEQETIQALLNARATLGEINLQLNDVIKATVFLTDVDRWDDMNRGYVSVFGSHKPARTSVGVIALPRGASVEIELVAALPALRDR